MRDFNQAARKSHKAIADSAALGVRGLLTGNDARETIERLVYGTRLANDHVLHELETRYGTVVAQWLMEQMP